MTLGNRPRFHYRHTHIWVRGSAVAPQGARLRLPDRGEETEKRAEGTVFYPGLGRACSQRFGKDKPGPAPKPGRQG